MKIATTHTTDFINYLKRVCGKQFYDKETTEERTKYIHKDNLSLSLKKIRNEVGGPNNYEFEITLEQPLSFDIKKSPLSKLHIIQTPLDVKTYGIELVVKGFLDKDIDKNMLVDEVEANLIIPQVQRINRNKYFLNHIKAPLPRINETQLDEMVNKVHHNLLNRAYFI